MFVIQRVAKTSIPVQSIGRNKISSVKTQNSGTKSMRNVCQILVFAYYHQRELV